MADLHVGLPHDPTGAALARREVRRFSAEHRFDETEPLLIVTELVSNAVRRGARPVWLHAICRVRRVRFELFDSDPDVSRVARQPLEVERPGAEVCTSSSH